MKYETRSRWLLQEEFDSREFDYSRFRYLLGEIKSRSSEGKFCYKMTIRFGNILDWIYLPSNLSERKRRAGFKRFKIMLDEQIGKRNVRLNIRLGMERIVEADMAA